MYRFRPRGIGCFGCLPFGGLLIGVLPLIAIGFLIYWLVNRQSPAAPPPAKPAGGLFCSHCGKPMQAGEKFCANCGSSVG